MGDDQLLSTHTDERTSRVRHEASCNWLASDDCGFQGSAAISGLTSMAKYALSGLDFSCSCPCMSVVIREPGNLNNTHDAITSRLPGEPTRDETEEAETTDRQLWSAQGGNGDRQRGEAAEARRGGDIASVDRASEEE